MKEYEFNDCEVCTNPDVIASHVHPFGKNNVLVAWEIEVAETAGGWVYGCGYISPGDCGMVSFSTPCASVGKKYPTRRQSIIAAARELLHEEATEDRESLRRLIFEQKELNLFE